MRLLAPGAKLRVCRDERCVRAGRERRRPTGRCRRGSCGQRASAPPRPGKIGQRAGAPTVGTAWREGTLGHWALAGLKVADIAMGDGVLGTDDISLSGLDAGRFKIGASAQDYLEGRELSALS